jgi:hypothetical protein
MIGGHGRTAMPGLAMPDDEDVPRRGRIGLVFRDGIAYDPSRLREAVPGKFGG